MQSVLVVVVIASLLPQYTSSRACESLEESLSPLLNGPDDTWTHTVRRVELVTGTDDISCLNAARGRNQPPCGTLEYALQRTPNAEVDNECRNSR